jgi:hypothetical protein
LNRVVTAGPDLTGFRNLSGLCRHEATPGREGFADDLSDFSILKLLTVQHRHREFFKVEFSGLTEVIQGGLDRLALGGGFGLRIQGDVTAFGGRGQYGGKFHHVTSINQSVRRRVTQGQSSDPLGNL